jgi:hypothetical protein
MPGDTMPLSSHFSNAHVILGIVAGLSEMCEVRLCRVVGTDYLINWGLRKGKKEAIKLRLRTEKMSMVSLYCSTG